MIYKWIVRRVSHSHKRLKTYERLQRAFGATYASYNLLLAPVALKGTPQFYITRENNAVYMR